MSVEASELAKRIVAAKHGFPAHIDRQGVGHYVLKLSASELDALASQAELLIEAERVLEPFAKADARVTGFDPADSGYYHAHTVQYVGLHDYEAARSLLLRIQAVKG